MAVGIFAIGQSFFTVRVRSIFSLVFEVPGLGLCCDSFLVLVRSMFIHVLQPPTNLSDACVLKYLSTKYVTSKWHREREP